MKLGPSLRLGAFLAYLAFMLTITLLILHKSNPTVNLVPFRSIIHDCTSGDRQAFIVNFLGNVIAFMPIGYLFPARGWRRAVGFTFLFSLTIEVLQYASGRRVADVDDVLLNTLGGALGAWIAVIWPGDTPH